MMGEEKEKAAQAGQEIAAAEETEAAPEVDVKEALKERRDDEGLEAELTEQNDRFLRLVAEYDNYRKRTEREKQASISYGMASAIEALLPPLDALEAAASAECADAEYKKGVDMTLSIYRAALASLGVEEIESAGAPFDPALHNAVSRESREGAESGTVATVLQKGYRMGERVLRHAVVTVAD